MEYRIPFNCARLEGDELERMAESVANGCISGDGVFTHECQSFLETLLGAPKALLTTSCTHALEMAALLLDIRDGDEVILPAFTFVSCANAFVLRGARPVFADIRPDTLNLDEQRIERLVTSRTRAIVVVHYAGVGCEMDVINEIAERSGLTIIEDNAHGLFGKYRGQHLGTFGALATQSFHETKNITCGEGGALLINDPVSIERAEIIREKGTDRSRFFRGLVDKYTWIDTGSSYLPSDLLAAFLSAQLEAWETIQARRKHLWETYGNELAQWAKTQGARMAVIPEHCEQAYHMFYLLMPSQEERARLMAHLKGQGILSVFHYLPLNLSEMGQRFGGRAGDCPVAEDISERLLRLPFYTGMTDAEQHDVIQVVQAFRSGGA
ncbi:MAG: dTDP-4-amino-4,6-dideoxygalactose transaminase [Candidatus Hydrogenedentes bacterium]|nr:dTDP-4-amino-4,6-dideoxygalactose transaminase [Candidatus Hydrogenedentota bacterium]